MRLQAALPFGWLALAAVLGTAAWAGHPAGLLLSFALPGLLHRTPTAGWAAHALRGVRWPLAVAAAWWLPGTLTLAPVIGRYFGADASLLLIVGLPLALTLVQTVPFALIAPEAGSRARALRMVAVLVLITLPPFGLVCWRNPLFVAGAVAPGLGWMGIAVSMALFAALAARSNGRALAAVAATALALNLPGVAPGASEAVAGWHAVNTAYPGERSPAGLRGEEIAALILPLLQPGTRVIVLPEGVLSPRTPADDVALAPVDVRARRLGVTVLVGATTEPDARGVWRNGVLALGAQRGWIHEARVPMPAGNWRPGRGGVPANILGSGLRPVGDQTVAFSICYEDTILWPHRELLAGRADLLVSMGNRWALNGSYAARSQDIAATLLSRLAGVPMIRAVNEGAG